MSPLARSRLKSKNSRLKKLHRTNARRRFRSTIGLGAFLICVGIGVAYWGIQSVTLTSPYVQDSPGKEVAEEAAALPATVSASAKTSLATQSAGLHIPILMYHYVEHVQDKKDTMRQKLDTTPEILDSQLQALQDAHYTFLFASDVAAILDGKETVPSKPIVLTFDDGYRDFYTDAFPILKKHGVKSTQYVISGFLGKPNYMFKPQLIEIAQSGIVEIGAHTVHHIDLSLATSSQAETEIAQSKVQLEKLLNIPVTTFAYPGGRFNDQSVKTVEAAGFSVAVSTKPGSLIIPSNRFTLYRFRPGGRSGRGLVEFLERVGV